MTSAYYIFCDLYCKNVHRLIKNYINMYLHTIWSYLVAEITENTPSFSYLYNENAHTGTYLQIISTFAFMPNFTLPLCWDSIIHDLLPLVETEESISNRFSIGFLCPVLKIHTWARSARCSTPFALKKEHQSCINLWCRYIKEVLCFASLKLNCLK